MEKETKYVNYTWNASDELDEKTKQEKLEEEKKKSLPSID